MTLPYRILALLLFSGTLFGAGWFVGDSQVRTVEVERVVDRVVEKQGETRIEYRDRIVTVTKVVTPDGTTTETTKTEEKQKDTQASTKETDHVEKRDEEAGPQKGTVPSIPRYALGLSFRTAPSALLDPEIYRDYRNYTATAGIRILGPAWVEVGGGGDGQLSLGIRIEF